jgi:replicative DNA helicase
MQGSAHWYNKCDKGLYVVRPNRDPDVGSTCEVEIHVLKVRNGDSGRVGITKLEFQPEIRSYKELVPEMA